MIRTALPSLRIRSRDLLPVVQGGMGVCISASRLAGAVAREGAVGTIAGFDLRHLHPDLDESSRGRDVGKMNEANRLALVREIDAAKKTAAGRGLVAVNVMKAVSTHEDLVRTAAESGADAIVMGAGLPLDLPEITREHPSLALIPILSDARGIGVVLRKWMRRQRLPDAIVIEHPRHAGGHLGAPDERDLADPRFAFENVLEGAFRTFHELGLERESIPLIPAGAIDSFEKVRTLLGLGASAVQIGTPFAVTEEGDAHPNFKRVLLDALPEDIVTFMSAAGLPARGVRTPWLERYLAGEAALREKANALRARCQTALDCLSHCGLRDGVGKMGQFCIESRLVAAFRGDVENGLFFRGAGTLPFGSRVASVRELLEHLLGGETAPA